MLNTTFQAALNFHLPQLPIAQIARTTQIAQTHPWTINVAIVMILCNLLAILIGRYTIQQKGVGPNLPIQLPGLFANFGIPELLATTSFGHLLGVIAIVSLEQGGAL
jgi:photosystem I subunit X